MASAVSLPEPQVLAYTKRRLFPDDGRSDAYAVSDTQFSTETWLSERSIPTSVREQLAPFNHVRVGSGYPDLVGVRTLDPEFLAVERFGDEPPLVAIEAKGRTGSGGVDVERGVVQAYDRLQGSNAAYVAAPIDAVSRTDRTLASELNVGVIGVDTGGNVRPLEVPRVVGNRTSDDASAIRFQATAQGVTDRSFGLNHPKNYLAYPLALYDPGNTEAILSKYVVRATDEAHTGAAFLGLVEERPNRIDLTPLGKEVVRFALDRHGTVEAALETFEEWTGSRKRFCKMTPMWGSVARRVVWSYPATELLVTELEAMAEEGVPEPSLVDLVEWLFVSHPTFTVELFVRGTDEARRRALTPDGELRTSALSSGDLYHSPTVFQLKAMLYHAGILADRGAEPNRLDPRSDSWALRHPLGPITR